MLELLSGFEELLPERDASTERLIGRVRAVCDHLKSELLQSTQDMLRCRIARRCVRNSAPIAGALVFRSARAHLLEQVSELRVPFSGA